MHEQELQRMQLEAELLEKLWDERSMKCICRDGTVIYAANDVNPHWQEAMGTHQHTIHTLHFQVKKQHFIHQ